jgi:hypothetical protein
VAPKLFGQLFSYRLFARAALRLGNVYASAVRIDMLAPNTQDFRHAHRCGEGNHRIQKNVRTEVVLGSLKDAGALLCGEIDYPAVVFFEATDLRRAMRDPFPLDGHAEDMTQHREFTVARGL